MDLQDFESHIRSMVTNDLQEVEATRLCRQPTIYHYTDVKGALAILASRELWFTERIHLNDTEEMTHGLRVATEILVERAKDEIPSVADGVVSRLKDTHESRLETFGYWSFSASLNNDDLGQWVRYADDGRGICLGLSFEKLRDKFAQSEIRKSLPHVHHARHFCVDYCTNRLRAKLKPYIDQAIKVLANLDIPPRDDKTWINEYSVFFYLNAGLYLHAMLHKDKAYEQEKEYRFFISGQRDAFARYDCHCVRERNREIVSYLKLPVPSWKGVLMHIRIGPAAPDQLRYQVSTALNSLGIPLPELGIDKSEIPYRNLKAD